MPTLIFTVSVFIFIFHFISLLLNISFELNLLKCLFNGLAESLLYMDMGDDIRHSYYVLNVEYQHRPLSFFCANKFCMKICK